MKKYSSITRVNSHRTSRNRQRIYIVIGLVLLLALLWLSPRVIGAVAATLLKPIQATEQWLLFSGARIPSYLRDRTTLISEIESLQAELAKSETQRAEQAALWWENRVLRAIVRADEQESGRVLAAVIGRPNTTPYDVLVLDRGSDDGIVVGAPVYTASSTVVGVVKNVFSDSAVVELISTPGFKTSVYVYGPNIYTNAEGMGSGVLRVGVPQGIVLTEGDPVVIPAVELGVFGTITHIESEPSSPEQFGYVTSVVPLQSLRFVTVGQTPMIDVAFESARANVRETIDRYFTVAIPDDVLVELTPSTTSATTTDDVLNETNDNE